MMIRTLCLLFLAGLAAARPSAKADAKIMYRYLVPGSYYPYYGLRSLDGEPMTNVITPEEAVRVEDIKTPEEMEPILHLGGVPVVPAVEMKEDEKLALETLETKEVEEPIKEVEEPVKEFEEPIKEIKETETLDKDTSEILPAEESDIEDVTEKVEFAEVPEETETLIKEPEILPVIPDVTEKVEYVNVPEEAVIITDEITEAPMVVEIVTQKDERKNLTGVIPALSVLVKPLSQYSQYLPALSQYSSFLPSMSWLPSFSSWWPFRYDVRGDVSRFSDASRFTKRVY